MKKISIIGVSAFIAFFSPRIFAEIHSNHNTQPNVVIILADDLGYGDLACHGNQLVRTPHLDQLCKEGVRFTDFHVSPRCTPTRASLTTGRYKTRTGAWDTDRFTRVRQNETMMAGIFHDNGYQTAMFGKWHLGDSYPYRPEDRGFEYVIRFRGWGITSGPGYWDNNYYNDIYIENGKEIQTKGYCTDVWFDKAIEFIGNNQNRPFFAYIAINTPHAPDIVEAKWADPYLMSLTEDSSTTYTAEGGIAKWADPLLKSSQKNFKKTGASFYGMVSNLDWNIGRLRDRLEELGIAENTLLIFLSDNGSRLHEGFNAGMRGKKGSPYEGGHRVPCFLYWPVGGLLDRTIDYLTIHMDLLPTLIDLCNLNFDPFLPLDGRSLMPVLKYPSTIWESRTLFIDDQGFIILPEKWRRSAVLTDSLRLINGRELYNIKQDPSQQKDLAKEHPEITYQLRNAYEEWWSDVTESVEDYPPIYIGYKQDNPVMIHAIEWHEATFENKLADHNALRSNQKAQGYWWVNVAVEGEYRFELRRWPVEAELAIEENVPPHEPETLLYIPFKDKQFPKGYGIKARYARLQIQDIDKTTDVHDGDKSVQFMVSLKKGKSKLIADFLDDNRKVLASAYYVYVKRME